MIKLIRPYKLFVLLFCCGLQLLAQPGRAQTSASGYVSSIEAKAREILALEAEIEALKQKINRLGVQKQESIDNAKRRLAEAIERTKTESSWKNRLQTAQNGWEENSPGTCSAGGPPPICSANHWHQTSVAASMAKYNEYLDDYLRPYREAVKNAGISEQKEMDQAGSDIDKKSLQVPELRKQLVALSKQYEAHMMEVAESKAKMYGMELARMLSEVHYQEDLVAQYKKLIEENDAKEVTKKKEASDRVKVQLESLKKKMELDIVMLENKYKQVIASQETVIDQQNTVITDQQSKINAIELKLQNFKGTETEKLALEEQKNALQPPLYRAQEKVRDITNYIRQLKIQLNLESTMIRNEIFTMTSDESKKIAAVRKLVEDAFSTQREMLLTSKTNAETRVTNMTQSYRLKKDERGKEFNKWVSTADGERVRVMRACQSVSCACYGTYVVNEANMAWNRTKDCLNTIDRVRRTNGSVYYSSCSALTAFYESLYKGYNGGNSTAEQETLERQKARNRFENLIDN